MATLSAAASPFCWPEVDPFLLLDSTLRSVQEILLRRRRLPRRRTWIEQPYGEEEITLQAQVVLRVVGAPGADHDAGSRRLVRCSPLLAAAEAVRLPGPAKP